jgi:hypothetical protein
MTMSLLRTTLATLVVVAMAGLVYGQKCRPPLACGPGGGCLKGCGGCGTGLKTCCGKQQCCSVECTTKQIVGPCFRCECTTVCSPAPVSGLGGGCGKGCGACSPCDKGCQACEPKACGKGSCGKIACDNLFPDLFNSFTCKGRVKKHLLMKSGVVCEIPCVTCRVAGKGGKGGMGDGYVPAAPEAEGNGDDATEAAPDVPDPPPVNVGRLHRGHAVPARYYNGGVFDLLLR